MRRSRAWSAAAGLALVAATACSNLSGLGGGSEPNTPTPPPINSLLIQHPQADWNADGRTITPTAIVLHWWDDWGTGKDISRLVQDLTSNQTTYNPKLKSTDAHPYVAHTTVQIGVLGNGQAYQLTPKLNTFARHAKCANDWAIGIEIEGFGPDHSHYIGNNKPQFDAVVKVVRSLMAQYNIKAVSVVASNGRSGQGIVSHKQVDAHCKWADGVAAGTGKVDVDDAYLKRVLAAVGG